MKHLFLIFAFLLAACGGDKSKPVDQVGRDLMNPAMWTVGPIINGQNHSHNVPATPIKVADGWAIDLPQNQDGVHYVTFPYGSLAGKHSVVMKYRVEMADGVRIVPSCCPQDGTSYGLTLFFQKRDDDWKTDGNRWWATFATHAPIMAGEYEVAVSLSDNWTSVVSKSASSAPKDFIDSKLDAAVIGFTLGGFNGTSGGFGHGVYATGPARIVVTDFEVN